MDGPQQVAGTDGGVANKLEQAGSFAACRGRSDAMYNRTRAVTREVIKMPARGAWRDGIAVGLIAYASVAVFYSVFDFLAARGTLYTVDLLGKAVFKGLRDPGILGVPIRLDPTVIFLYNALHFVVSLAIGLIVVRLVTQAERHPSQAPLMLLAIVGGFVVTIFAVGFLSAPMRPVLPWWSIVVANALATALAGLYLLKKRPGLWKRLLPFAV
jgi:hypothetical protein